jgi:hypothetical protein
VSALRTLGCLSFASALVLAPFVASSQGIVAPPPAPSASVSASAPSAASSTSATPSASESAVTSASAAPSAAPAASGSSSLAGRAAPGEAFLGRSVTTWDLNVELGYGAVLHKDEKPGFFFGRARAGVLNINEYVLYSMLGATVDVTSRGPVAFGLQGELLHLEAGFWFQLGALVDLKGHFGGAASVGFSLLGVEVENRDYGDEVGRGWSILGKLRIPIAIIYRALRPRH